MEKEWKLGDPNKTKSYVLPMIINSMSEVKSDKPGTPEYQFLNSFIGDDHYNIEDHILLLYKFSGQPWFIQFEEKLEKHPHFVYKYDPDKYHVMFVFKVPDEYKEDFKKFKEGKYSEFSQSYKDKIGIVHKSSFSVLKAVLYREESAYKKLENEFGIKIPRTQEASSLPIREKEYYQSKYRVTSALVSNTSNNEL